MIAKHDAATARTLALLTDASCVSTIAVPCSILCTSSSSRGHGRGSTAFPLASRARHVSAATAIANVPVNSASQCAATVGAHIDASSANASDPPPAETLSESAETAYLKRWGTKSSTAGFSRPEAASQGVNLRASVHAPCLSLGSAGADGMLRSTCTAARLPVCECAL